MKQNGFTLIELLLAIVILGILGYLGIAGFSSYNKSQTISTSASEVVTMLNLARSRAQAQIKPVGCVGNLRKYKVDIARSNLPGKNKYTLIAECVGGSIAFPEQTKYLPSNLFFCSNAVISFPVKTGSVDPGVLVFLIGSKYNPCTTSRPIRTIMIDGVTGGVSVQ